MIKRSHCITLLFITFALNTHAMAPEDNNPNKTWISFAADVILYSADAYREFLSYIHSAPTPTVQTPKSRFELLPKEMQQTIIFSLSERTKATTLKDAAHAISTLARVNQHLNQLINDPAFCLQIIKQLAQQFDCSDETAAAALQTQEAKKRLKLQKQCEELFIADKFNEKLFNQLYKQNTYIDLNEQRKHYIDLNFTYSYSKDSKLDTQNTLLIIAVGGTRSNKDTKVDCLLKNGPIDINYYNKANMTALITCAGICENSKALELLCKSPNIIIDLTDEVQSTALHYACWCRDKKDKSKYIEILLKAGADPEAANIDGLTPLIILKRTGDDENEQRNLIKNAIKRKHEKK